MESHWDRLPEHLQDHIRSFIPLTCMPKNLQRDIQVQAALVQAKRLDNLWYVNSENHSNVLVDTGLVIDINLS